MGKRLKEYFLVILIAGLAALFGLALMVDVFVADTVRTEILAATPVRSSTYEVEEHISRDDPDYDPVSNTTRTVHDTKYYRVVTVEVDGKQHELELGSGVKFLLPGQGQKITLRRDYDDSFLWDHPLRYFLLGAVLTLGGTGVIIFTLSPDPETEKAKKRKNKKKKK